VQSKETPLPTPLKMLVPPLDRLLKLPDDVVGLANFAEPTGEFGTVERTNAPGS